MRALSAAQMAAADRHAIEDLGIPVAVLMENAARAVVEAAARALPNLAECRVLVVAGTGNNGGDGLAAARHLRNRGVHVEVVLVGQRAAIKSDATRGNAETLARLGVSLLEAADVAAWRRLAPELEDFDVVVDALFGTGLSRSADGLAAEVIDSINQLGGQGAFVVAVDVPSGMASDSGTFIGPAVTADLTVSLAAAKLCHLLPPACDQVGELVVADISIPPAALEPPGPAVRLATRALVAALVPERRVDSHKGSYGHVLVVAGSRGKSGAAVLAGTAALRAGAGLVTVATPASVRAEVAAARAELMTESLGETRAGTLAAEALADLTRLAATRQVVALGPGLSTDPETTAAIRSFLKTLDKALVLDADGLNAYAGRLAELAHLAMPRVLTPHPGEAARLLGIANAVVQRDRLATARMLAGETGAVVVLKGHRTLVATAEGEVWVNPTGNPGMAKAGTGDVLTGIIAGLLAQGLEPWQAAVLGVHLHGLAGDLAVRDLDVHALLASDLLDRLPAAFADLGRG